MENDWLAQGEESMIGEREKPGWRRGKTYPSHLLPYLQLLQEKAQQELPAQAALNPPTAAVNPAPLPSYQPTMLASKPQKRAKKISITKVKLASSRSAVIAKMAWDFPAQQLFHV
jgi:hypothetical protein